MKTGFRIGRVLSVGLRIWVRNLVPLVLQTALVHAPAIAWGCIVAAGEPDRQQYYSIVSFEMLLYTPLVAVNALASGMVAPGVIKELQGQRLAFRTRLARGLARSPAAFGTLLLGALSRPR